MQNAPRRRKRRQFQSLFALADTVVQLRRNGSLPEPANDNQRIASTLGCAEQISQLAQTSYQHAAAKMWWVP